MASQITVLETLFNFQNMDNNKTGKRLRMEGINIGTAAFEGLP
jgi:hypothetical protein